MRDEWNYIFYSAGFVSMRCAIIWMFRGYLSLLSDHFYFIMSSLWAFSFSKWFSNGCSLSLSPSLSHSLLLYFCQCSLCCRFKEISEDCSRGQIKRPIPSSEPRPQQPFKPGPGTQLRNNIIASDYVPATLRVRFCNYLETDPDLIILPLHTTTMDVK